MGAQILVDQNEWIRGGNTDTITYVFCISKRIFICGCNPLGPLKPGNVGDPRGKRPEGLLSSERGEMRMSKCLGSRNVNRAVLKSNSRNFYCIMCSVIISDVSAIGIGSVGVLEGIIM